MLREGGSRRPVKCFRMSRRLTVLAVLLLATVLLSTLAAGSTTALLYLLPALVFSWPLIARRYPGERRLLALAGAVPKRRPVPAAAPAVFTWPRATMPRGGLLIASSMAVRPPPLLPVAT